VGPHTCTAVARSICVSWAFLLLLCSFSVLWGQLSVSPGAAFLSSPRTVLFMCRLFWLQIKLHNIHNITSFLTRTQQKMQTTHRLCQHGSKGQWMHERSQTDGRPAPASWPTTQSRADEDECLKEVSRLQTQANIHTLGWMRSLWLAASTHQPNYSTTATAKQLVGWLVGQGLTSHSTRFRSFRRRCFYRSDDPTNSVKALKEGG